MLNDESEEGEINSSPENEGDDSVTDINMNWGRIVILMKTLPTS